MANDRIKVLAVASGGGHWEQLMLLRPTLTRYDIRFATTEPAVAAAHGLHCSRLDGSPLRYNQADTYMPDLLICRREWAESVLAELARLAR